MTANIMIAKPDGIVVLSDGMAYDKQGIARQFHTKQLVLPSISTVITCSSSGGALTVLQYLISNEAPLSFDELHDRMPNWTREVQDAMRQAHGSSTYAMFLYGGWSDREGGWVIYQVCDYEVDRGEVADPPFATRTFGCFAKPNASPEALAAVGLSANLTEDFARRDVSDFALRLMLALRRTEQREISGPGSIPGYVVGGFIEMTVLGREHAESFIAHRWPDEIGRPADPAHDPGVVWADRSQPSAT